MPQQQLAADRARVGALAEIGLQAGGRVRVGVGAGQVEGRIAFVRQIATRLRRLPPEAVIAATDHLQAVVGDGLMPSTILVEMVDAYTPVQARPDDYDLSDLKLDAYDAPQVDGLEL